ncbi:helix-turn-helix domain-containing protein [Streptomyces sp. GC420]|uniref:helix-turn-helix domain-containing protein n=1 Tax=Streptomyces sp. GC420 TaxID=2697568 RepID=UPI001414E3C9|nr:helix-turn-helix domain-containing protein [Streptomyces sp. GC420]NBM15124.1 helix-turn-helix domain-containing protein [Streptomyces sp. GC420]
MGLGGVLTCGESHPAPYGEAAFLTALDRGSLLVLARIWHGSFAGHARWKLAEGYTEPPEVAVEREQIRLAMALGQLVYDRRAELGLSQDDLARRLGTSADEVDSIEVGGVLPVTSDLLARLAAALEVGVDVHLAPSGGAAVSFDRRAA